MTDYLNPMPDIQPERGRVYKMVEQHTGKPLTYSERIEKLEKEIKRLKEEIARIKRFGDLRPVIGTDMEGRPLKPVVRRMI